MSKKDLKIYLKGLKKKQLEDQVLDLYDRFKQVKNFYNFVFKPQEEQLLEEAKFKITKEYFPVGSRKPKARRSVAQNYIKHYIQLGVDAYVVAEIMLHNIEVAQRYHQKKGVKQETFFKSMLKSFEQAVEYIAENQLNDEFNSSMLTIIKTIENQQWMNAEAFQYLLRKVI
ncbi:MAG TPA: DUF6155 family protein [Vicingus sp.]|nr:DUF6155 family protein [Vicingus sp.]